MSTVSEFWKQLEFYLVTGFGHINTVDNHRDGTNVFGCVLQVEACSSATLHERHVTAPTERTHTLAISFACD